MTIDLVLLVLLGLVLVAAIACAAAWRRSFSSRAEAVAFVRENAGELARLPGRLRRVASDERTPRRARWWLVGIALYIASPIDLIPDFIPVLGQIDDLVIVPLALRHVKRMIPDEVWSEHFARKLNLLKGEEH
jgi:uncharacterized membrane protein YkvA (DUF1232 family)